MPNLDGFSRRVSHRPTGADGSNDNGINECRHRPRRVDPGSGFRPALFSILAQRPEFPRKSSIDAIAANYAELRSSLEAGEPILEDVQLPSADVCWSCKQSIAPDAKDCDECGAPAHTTDTQKLRYLIFVCFEIKKLTSPAA